MGFSRQEYWSGVPFPSPEFTVSMLIFGYLAIGIDTTHALTRSASLAECCDSVAANSLLPSFLRGLPLADRSHLISHASEEISPEYSLEGLMLKLKLQYFGHLMCRTDSLEKTLMLGKIEGRRRRGRQRMRWLDGITNAMDMSLSRL